MPTNQPESDHFVLRVTGERLRQILGARMARIEASITSEATLAATGAAHEKVVREHNEMVHKQLADLHAGMVGGIGAMPRGSVAGDMMPAPFPMPAPQLALGETETPSERHLRTADQLRATLVEIRWLSDNIDPATQYVLDKDDLQLFGDFGAGDGILNAAVRRIPGLSSLI